MSSKSQSKIIAAVLLIILVLAAIVVLWNVVSRLINEGTSSVESQSKCFGVSLSIDKISDKVFSIKKIGGEVIQPEPSIVFLVDGNSANCELWEPIDSDWSDSLTVARCTFTNAPVDSLEAALVVDGNTACPFRGYWRKEKVGGGSGGTGDNGGGGNGVSFPTDYVAYWKFEDNVKDETGANDGTVVGNSVYTQGKVGNAILLNGIDGYVNVGNGVSLQMTDVITISAWVKPDSLDFSSVRNIFSKRYETNDGGYYLRAIDGGQVHFRVMKGLDGSITDETDVKSTGLLTIGEWYHIVGVYDGTNKYIYVNGISQSEPATGTFGSSPKNAYIGARPDGTNRFIGSIDELIVYHRGLTESEVQKIYCDQGGTC